MTSGVVRPPAARGRSLPPWPASRPLRDWQQRALEALAEHDGESFLASATPAAGKTTFGLRVAWEMLSSGRVERVVVAAPTTHICRQWAKDAARYGIDLDPNRPNSEGREPPDRHGVTVTYQTIAAGPEVHASGCRRPTLLIADEPHHMGEHAAWGQRTLAAFERAEHRLLLSGTPFRSDDSPIPWVVYDEDGVSRADFAYGYTDALLDRVCRPITFLTYDGDMEWMSDGRKRSASFSVVLPRQEAARRLRTALAADGDWIGDVLRDADARLSEVREAGHRDAGGLVIAADKDHARALAARLGRIAGEEPMVVTSDDPDSSERIARFNAGDRRWIVAVLMVSEGVDIPRLRVGVYATAARTELFFRQVIGRFIRRTPSPRTQMAYLLMPSDPQLKALAARVEEERNHALAQRPEADEEREAPDHRAAPGEGFAALSSQARLDEAIMSSTAPGETLPLFADPSAPAPSPALAAFTTGAAAAPASSGPAGQTAYERRERLRDERRALVSALTRRTGEPHRAIHARVNRATGAASVSAATVEQLEKGNALLEREIARGRG